MEQSLTWEEKVYLLRLARDTIQKAIERQALPHIDAAELTPPLAAQGASFVTLTIAGDLRGCIGSLEAYQSLAEDVRDHARQAALEDYRFPPVSREEVDLLHIEISRLTPAKALEYSRPEDLPALLHAGHDGVILKDGFKRATFLPQVWKQLPDPQDFLSHLCSKMGSAPDAWRHKRLEVSIYHVEDFEEDH